MPEVSRFFGIVIAIFDSDHAPPHFHIRYGGQAALMAIESFAILDGDLSPRVLGMVAEWARLHRRELMENWERARKLELLQAIAPLE